MNLDSIFSIAGGIVTVAMVFVVASNANSVAVIEAIGKSFADVIYSATGQSRTV